MLQKTFEIIKVRWPEVTLIVVSQAAMMLLFEEMVRRWGLDQRAAAAAAPEWAMFLLGVSVAGLVIVWHLLFLGFLKTAAMEGPVPQEPLKLLLTGRAYLWRILLVQLVLAMILWAVTGVLLYFAGGRAAVEQPSGWLIEIAGGAATVLLFKPFLLVPALVVALDLKIGESFLQMLRIRLADTGQLPKAVVIGYGAVTLLGVLLSFAPKQGALMYMASGVNYLAKSMNVLVLLTLTVLWTVDRFLPPAPPIHEE
jgi:hypothetical protein